MFVSGMANHNFAGFSALKNHLTAKKTDLLECDEKSI